LSTQALDFLSKWQEEDEGGPEQGTNETKQKNTLSPVET
jgi:hypothetical protein